MNKTPVANTQTEETNQECDAQSSYAETTKPTDGIMRLPVGIQRQADLALRLFITIPPDDPHFEDPDYGL